jgi:hypothetical protein
VLEVILINTKRNRTIFEDSMSLSDPDLWAAILGGGIIGAVISALTTIFLGARWVERSRLKREHSMKLVTGALRPWTDHWWRYCEFGAVYSIEKDGFSERLPKDPDNLELFDALKEHLQKEYPQILESWSDLKKAVIAHNKDRACFSDEIRAQLMASIKLLEHYPSLTQRAPEEYVIPENVAEQVYHAMRYEIVNRADWFGEVKLTHVPESDRSLSNLLSMNNVQLAKARNANELSNITSLIKQIIQSPEKKQQMERFVEKEDKIIPAKAKDFEKMVKEVAKRVELGNRLKGKCKYCP